MTLHYGTDLFEDISSSLKLTQANEIIRQASPEATNFIRKLGYSASNDGIKVYCWRVYEALRVHRADITQFHPHLVWSLPRRRSKYSRVDENILTISSSNKRSGRKLTTCSARRWDKSITVWLLLHSAQPYYQYQYQYQCNGSQLI
jgi:hypothetical protein